VFGKELSDGDRILNFKINPNSVSVTQFLPKHPLSAAASPSSIHECVVEFVTT